MTGRKRRCGWLDTVMLKYACKLSSVCGIALTKLDVLDGFEKIKICTGYKLKGEKLKHIPLSIENMNHINPVYETLQGWNSSTQGILNFDKLPKNAKIYIRRIEELIDTRDSLLSTSPDRKDTIMIRDPFKI